METTIILSLASSAPFLAPFTTDFRTEERAGGAFDVLRRHLEAGGWALVNEWAGTDTEIHTAVYRHGPHVATLALLLPD